MRCLATFLIAVLLLQILPTVHFLEDTTENSFEITATKLETFKVVQWCVYFIGISQSRYSKVYIGYRLSSLFIIQYTPNRDTRLLESSGRIEVPPLKKKKKKHFRKRPCGLTTRYTLDRYVHRVSMKLGSDRRGFSDPDVEHK